VAAVDNVGSSMSSVCSCTKEVNRSSYAKIAFRKLVTWKERLLQGAGGSAGTPVQSIVTITVVANQQAVERLRPLLLIIPASRLGQIHKTVSGDSKKKRIGELDSSDDRGKWRQQKQVRKSVPIPHRQLNLLLCS
jgi:hypothetical protein